MEIRTQALPLVRVNHPAVVRVHYPTKIRHPEPHGVADALVMEFVEGTPLDECTELSPEVAFAAIGDIAAGLDAIRAFGLAHADLHEGNILVGGGFAKIIDLLYTGTRRVLNERRDSSRSSSITAACFRS